MDHTLRNRKDELMRLPVEWVLQRYRRRGQPWMTWRRKVKKAVTCGKDVVRGKGNSGLEDIVEIFYFLLCFSEQ